MRFPGRQLRTRIIWTTALVSGLAMAAMIGTMVLTLSAVTGNSVDSTLADRFSVISSSVASGPDGFAKAVEGSDDAIDDSTWIYDHQAVKLDGPRVGKHVQAVADHLGKVTQRTRFKSHERVYLAGPVTMGGDGGRGVLVVSQSLDPYEATRVEILIGLILLGLLVTAGATGIAAWAVARTLAPVESMALLADDWSERRLDARFDDLGSENEIAHLGGTLNALLDRVSGALRGEQRLTSELAHELRTPLTGIRGEAELALMAEPDSESRERLDRVIMLCDQMSATITTLLSIARGDERLETHTTVDAVIAATVEGRDDTVRRIARVEVPEGLRLNATTQLAVRALSPLVDNALHHAATTVTIAVQAAARTVGISVSDDGPGLDPGLVVTSGDPDPDLLFGAGTRAVESPGTGLGLSLARRVARTLGGDVQVTSGHDPTTFTLTLPRA